MELGEAEVLYKRLYEEIPKVWETPVNDWAELTPYPLSKSKEQLF